MHAVEKAQPKQRWERSELCPPNRTVRPAEPHVLLQRALHHAGPAMEAALVDGCVAGQGGGVPPHPTPIARSHVAGQLDDHL